MMRPGGLRWTDHDETSATLRTPISQTIAWFIACVWNFGLPIVVQSNKKPGVFMAVGFTAGAVFLFLAIRSIFKVTKISFEKGELVVRTPLAPWATRRIPLSDIGSFVVVPQPDFSFRVSPTTRTGASLGGALPLDVEPLPFPLVMKGSKKQLWPAPYDHAEFLAGRLYNMAEAARRAGHDTYRT